MERRASETKAYAIFSGPLLLHSLLSTSKHNLFSSLRRTPNFQSWSAIILSIGLPSLNSDENRSILAAVFTKHKRHQVLYKLRLTATLEKKDNSRIILSSVPESI